MLVLAAVCSVVLLFGVIMYLFICVCWKRKTRFSNFEDSLEVTSGSYQLTSDTGLYSPPSVSTPESIDPEVTFDPLPTVDEVLAKRNSRASLNSISKQLSSASLGDPRRISLSPPGEKESSFDFPREQIQFVKEMGTGWFGQVLQGEAQKITVGLRKSKIVIKMLSDEAGPHEQVQFLKEITPYRDIEHANVMKCLGQCINTFPFLVLLEYFPFGDLKSYLLSHRADLPLYNQRGTLLKFACDMAGGLQCMHQRGFVHHDIAIRNCQVSSDLSIKVGDYGISTDIYKDDYYRPDEESEGIPIRWLPPESLDITSVGHIRATDITMSVNIWSFGVALWEMVEFGRLPYDKLTNESILGKLRQRHIELDPPNTSVQHTDKLYEVMQLCWAEADDRPSMETVHATLDHLVTHIAEMETEQFNARWKQLVPKSTPKVHHVSRVNSRTQSFETDFVRSEIPRLPPDGMSEKDENETAVVQLENKSKSHDHSEVRHANGLANIHVSPITNKRRSNGIVMGTRASLSSLSSDGDQYSPQRSSSFTSFEPNMHTSTPLKVETVPTVNVISTEETLTTTPMKVQTTPMNSLAFSDPKSSGSSEYLTAKDELQEYDTRRSSSTTYNTLDYYTPRPSLLLSPADENEELQEAENKVEESVKAMETYLYITPQTSVNSGTGSDSISTPNTSGDEVDPLQTFSAFLDTIHPPSETPPPTPPTSQTPPVSSNKMEDIDTLLSDDLVNIENISSGENEDIGIEQIEAVNHYESGSHESSSESRSSESSNESRSNDVIHDLADVNMQISAKDFPSNQNAVLIPKKVPENNNSRSFNVDNNVIEVSDDNDRLACEDSGPASNEQAVSWDNSDDSAQSDGEDKKPSFPKVARRSSLETNRVIYDSRKRATSPDTESLSSVEEEKVDNQAEHGHELAGVSVKSLSKKFGGRRNIVQRKSSLRNPQSPKPTLRKNVSFTERTVHKVFEYEKEYSSPSSSDEAEEDTSDSDDQGDQYEWDLSDIALTTPTNSFNSTVSEQEKTVEKQDDSLI